MPLVWWWGFWKMERALIFLKVVEDFFLSWWRWNPKVKMERERGWSFVSEFGLEDQQARC